MRSLIDLSLPIMATPSEATPVKIVALAHAEAPAIFGLQTTDFPGGIGISNEQIEITTHTGTHMDAPLHYGPFSGGRAARSIDEIPLEWCYGRGVRLDLRHCAAGAGISSAEIEQAVAQTGTRLSPLDIVLLWTGSDRLWGSSAYLTDYPGLTRESVACLVEQGVRMIGIDTWGLDRPVGVMLHDYRETQDQTYLWPAHCYGREHEYCQLEKLANLHLLPAASGFQVICFPVCVAGVGAAWSRVVAVVE